MRSRRARTVFENSFFFFFLMTKFSEFAALLLRIITIITRNYHVRHSPYPSSASQHRISRLTLPSCRRDRRLVGLKFDYINFFDRLARYRRVSSPPRQTAGVSFPKHARAGHSARTTVYGPVTYVLSHSFCPVTAYASIALGRFAATVSSVDPTNVRSSECFFSAVCVTFSFDVNDYFRFRSNGVDFLFFIFMEALFCIEKVIWFLSLKKIVFVEDWTRAVLCLKIFSIKTEKKKMCSQKTGKSV